MSAIKRPALRYYGGKFRLAPWIISHLPEHTCYVEPCAGGASVLLQKTPAQFEVLNDLNQEVVNFFRVLREQSDELIKAIKFTPYARMELAAACEPTTDQVEAARRFYVRCWQSRYGGRARNQSTGWRFQRGGDTRDRVTRDWSNIDHLYNIADRLKLVQVDCGSAFDIIKRYDAPETLFYLDPPYVLSTRADRTKNHGYAFEMSDQEHIELAALLHDIEGKAVISGYPSPLYAELYLDWYMEMHQTINDASKEITECLWISPAARQEVQRQLF